MKSKKKSRALKERVDGNFSSSCNGTQQLPSAAASLSNYSSHSDGCQVAKRRIFFNTSSHLPMKKSLLQIPNVFSNEQVCGTQALLPISAGCGGEAGTVMQFSTVNSSANGNYNVVGNFEGYQMQQSFMQSQNASHMLSSFEVNNRLFLPTGVQQQFAENTKELGRTFSPPSAKGYRSKIKKRKRRNFQTSTANISSSMATPVNRGDIVRQLRALIGTPCYSNEEKYLLLKKRDELMYKARLKNTDVSVMRIVQGTCPDMCPEKERYRRETQKNVSQFECDHLGRMNPALTVKDYSRSAADQEEPLPHELRPPLVLKMTMDYLIDAIARHIPPDGANLARWYDFLWSRTRSIRKEISQQMLCNEIAVDLVEKCIRLHAFASFWLANLHVSDFDPKMNRENLSKCLQTLRHMYEDLASQGIVSLNEAEFRCYDMLLNLCDSNVHSYVCSYRAEVRKSPQVQFALMLAASLQSNNYVKFFRLLKNSADFLQTCLCHQYLSLVRLSAMEIVCSAYKLFSFEKFMEVFAFEKDKDAKDFLAVFGIGLEGSDNSSMELANGKLTFGMGGKLPRPESLPVGHCTWVLQKIRRPSLAEVLCNGRCESAKLPRPVDSFDENCRYTRDPFNHCGSFKQAGRSIQQGGLTKLITLD